MSNRLILLMTAICCAACSKEGPQESRDLRGAESASLQQLRASKIDPHDLVTLRYVYALSDLKDEDCRVLVRIPNLKKLDATRSRITDRGIELLSRSKSVETLYICGTPITDGCVESLLRMSSLQCLDIGLTDLSVDGILKLSKSEGLKELHLNRIPVTDDVVCQFAHANRIVTLSLDIDQVTPRGIQCLSRMSNVCQLEVLRRQLSSQELTYLGRLPKLTYLRCRVDILPDLMGILATFETLEDLDISPEPFQIDLDALLKLKALPNLKTLTVQPYHFSNEEREAISKTMPNVELIGGS